MRENHAEQEREKRVLARTDKERARKQVKRTKARERVIKKFKYFTYPLIKSRVKPFPPFCPKTKKYSLVWRIFGI